jgi:hypothetical protein
MVHGALDPLTTIVYRTDYYQVQKMDIVNAICDWRLGRYVNLPQLAVDALSNGLDSPSLRVLAGANPKEAGLGELFESAIDELGYSSVDKKYAAIYLSRQIAERITAGQIGEYEGAKGIWEIYDLWNPGTSNTSDLLWTFKSAASCIEDYKYAMDEFGSNYTTQIEEEQRRIAAAAKQLMALS